MRCHLRGLSCIKNDGHLWSIFTSTHLRVEPKELLPLLADADDIATRCDEDAVPLGLGFAEGQARDLGFGMSAMQQVLL